MKVVFIAAFLSLFSISSFAQTTEQERSWNQPVEPFKIAGNIYYVGASDITSYLITTPKGHILIDGGFPQTAPLIVDSINRLGFKPADIKFILNSHAHYDHAGGIAEIKRLTNAKLLVSRPDEILFLNGGRQDPNFGDDFAFEPVKPDKLLTDGEKVRLGNTTLTATITPGHTRGCTTWTTNVRENRKNFNVIFVCSTSSPGYKLTGNEKYPEIADDFTKTFAKLRSMKADIFLGSHGGFFGFADKIAKLNSGSSNPFIDPQGYKKYVESSEIAFRKKLTDQRRMAK